MITPSFSITATERVLPNLALDFTTASLDPRVTFTRSGNTATVINSSGALVAVNADVPRFDYTLNTGGVCKGFLIEESRTNLVFNSSNVLSGNWIQSIYNGGALNWYTVTNGATPTPGPGNSSYFIATATPGSIAARQTSLSLSSGVTYTISAYVYMPTQAGVSSWRMDNNFSGDYAIGATQTVFNSWVRVTNTITLTDARTLTDFNILVNSGGTPFAGVNFYMTNMQIEAGAFATSYIPTTTTTVTRNADVATMTGTNFSSWFNATQGTLVIQSAPSTSLFIAPGRVPVDINNGTDDTSINFRFRPTGKTGFVVNSAGSAQVNTSSTESYSQSICKIIGAYEENNSASSFNAESPVLDTVCTIPSGFNQLRFGASFTGISPFSGTIQKFMYFPQRLTDSELQAFSK